VHVSQGFSFLNTTCAEGRIMTARGRLLSCAMLACAALSLAGCIGNLPQGNGPDQPASRPTTPQIDASQNDAVFEVTPAAAQKVQEIIREGQASGALPKEKLYLRLRVVAGGCCGFLHKIDLDPDVAADDRSFTVGGVSAVVSSRQFEMLCGARVDYVASGKEVGFSVKNPNFEGEALKKWLPLLEAQEKAK
jgi:iron-sulfur cluster insertion protein